VERLLNGHCSNEQSSAQELALDLGHGFGPQRGLEGWSGSRRRIESGKEAAEPKVWLTGLILERRRVRWLADRENACLFKRARYQK